GRALRRPGRQRGGEAERGVPPGTGLGRAPPPPDYGWRRPTWTRELLAETLVRRTGGRGHPATLSRALARIKARRGRRRPTVGCPSAHGGFRRSCGRLSGSWTAPASSGNYGVNRPRDGAVSRSAVTTLSPGSIRVPARWPKSIPPQPARCGR